MSSTRQQELGIAGSADRRQPDGSNANIPGVSTENERDVYRSVLADLLAANKKYGPNSTHMTKAWNRARDLLKNGPPAAPVAQPDAMCMTCGRMPDEPCDEHAFCPRTAKGPR